MVLTKSQRICVKSTALRNDRIINFKADGIQCQVDGQYASVAVDCVVQR